ncbi:MAG: ribonuclease E/G, partial [Pseudomonadota bacterium]
MQGLDVPTGMGLIVRTAGAKRTKTDIKRDFDYLQKLWDKIRDLTLKSMAPTLINEEGGLVHRAMRDLYDKDIDEVLIQGETAYREAKDLAKLLMPSQSRKVKQWKDQAPVFVAKNIEDQLNSIFSPIVHLKSGGYLVINQTEALVAIDVNSGKSTRGRNIEQTATQTNLEAAEEACRQMRLRDLAGLIVIDFIDMDENKNNRAVEKRLKDCLKLDRARVQHGRISQFGLMEISRQRRRTGVLESSSVPCASCKGTGRQRSIESAALQLLRAIEARAAGGGLLSLSVSAPGEVALYLLNNKREAFTAIEDEAGIGVSIMSSEDLLPGEFSIDVKKDPSKKRRGRKSAPIVEGDPDDEEFAAQFQDDETDESDLIEEDDTSEEEDQARGRRGRGRRRRSSKRSDAPSVEADADSEVDEDADIEAASDEDGDEEEPRRKRRRRGRRGGRRRRRDSAVSDTALEAAAATEAALALPPIDSKRPVGKDLPPEDGGALLDGLSVTINEILDIDLQETRDVSRPETPGDAPNDDEESAERPKSSRRRRSRSKSRRSDRPERSESAAPDAAEGHGEVLVKALPPTDPSMEDAPAEEVPAPEAPVVANEAASEASPPEPEAPQVEPTASEVPEPVAVETPAEPEIKVEGSEKSEKPKRRGWWLRRKTG